MSQMSQITITLSAKKVVCAKEQHRSGEELRQYSLKGHNEVVSDLNKHITSRTGQIV